MVGTYVVPRLMTFVGDVHVTTYGLGDVEDGSVFVLQVFGVPKLCGAPKAAPEQSAEE